MPYSNSTWGYLLTFTSLAATITVNGLVTGLIVFRILKVFLEVKAANTSVEGTSDSTGSTKLRHIIFVLIESGMTLLVIQVIRLVLSIMTPNTNTGPVSVALNFFIGINQVFNVIIRSVHFYFFCFTENFTWLGNHTNNNFGAGDNEIVLRRRRILQGSCRKSSF